MNRADTIRLLAIVKKSWPDFDTSNDVVDVWQVAFADTSFADAQRGFGSYLRDDKPFAPRPGQIIAKIASVTTGEVVPEAAWSEVLSEVRRVGMRPTGYWAGGVYHDPPRRTFSHPLIAMAVEAIGWEDICTTEEQGVVRGQFVKALRGLLDQHKSDIREIGSERAMAALNRRADAAIGPGRRGMVAIGEIAHELTEGTRPEHSRGRSPESDPDRGRPPGNHEGGRTPDQHRGRPGSTVGRGGDWGRAGDVRISQDNGLGRQSVQNAPESTERGK